jgi:hypothetical protein
MLILLSQYSKVQGDDQQKREGGLLGGERFFLKAEVAFSPKLHIFSGVLFSSVALYEHC